MQMLTYFQVVKLILIQTTLSIKCDLNINWVLMYKLYCYDKEATIEFDIY